MKVERSVPYDHAKQLGRKRDFRLIPKIINGGIAGIVGVTCVFPIDLVKTRLQSQKTPPGQRPLYTGMIDCFKKSLAAGGFFKMYSGSAVNILLITPEKAIKLSANDYFRHFLAPPSGGPLPLQREVLAGAGAGFCQVVVTTPMELLKIQMQNAERVGKPAGKITATRLALDIVKTRGVLGLYKGTAATISRDVTFSIIYFPLFARINSMGPRRKDGSGEAVFWHSLMAGNVAGAVGAFAVTPLDVVKTRLQVISKEESEVKYKGIPDAFRKIASQEGLTAFFKGAACRMAVMAPLFGIAQMVYYIGVAEWLLGIRNPVKT